MKIQLDPNTVMFRWHHYLVAHGITKYECEHKLGLSKGYLSRSTNPTAGMICAFANNYPSCSMEWLIRGVGAMDARQASQSPD